MGEDGYAKTRQQGLQQAASMIFALVAVVPLLIFAWTLHAVGAMRNTQALVCLGLALAISLLGFWMFRSMLGRMAEVVQALAAAVEQANRMRRPAGSVTSTAAPAAVPAVLEQSNRTRRALLPTPGPASAAPRPVGAAPAAATVGTSAAPPAARKIPAADRHLPGVGNIREIAEVARTMDVLWHREATAHVGKRVQISVANARDALIGTITEVSDDGLILEQADGPMAVAYRRVTAIDRAAGQG